MAAASARTAAPVGAEAGAVAGGGAAGAGAPAGAAAQGGGMVKLEPTEVAFGQPTTQGGYSFSHHKLTNVGKEKVGMKIKCSDNRAYRLRPVFSLLEPGKDLTLTIARLPVPDKRDKLVVQIIALKAEQNDATAAWKGRSAPPDASITLFLSAPKAPAAAAPAAPPANVASAQPPAVPAKDAPKDPAKEPPKDPAKDKAPAAPASPAK